jgi:AcrR family transcriptional regulator
VPIQIDLAQRLRDIAEATLRVAGRDGVPAVTYRSVAAEMDSSTAVVTNYLPSRSALLLNALAHMNERWDEDSDGVTRRAPAGRQLEALARWSAQTTPDDFIARMMYLHLLAEPTTQSDTIEVLREEGNGHRASLFDAAVADGVDDAGAVADAVYLLCRGLYLTSVVDPDGWPDDRAEAAVDALLAGLRRGDPEGR